MTSKTCSIKENVDNWISSKLKNFVLCKPLPMRERKKQATDWTEMFSNHLSSKELIFRMTKNFSKCNNMKANSSIKNKQILDLNRCLTKGM